MSASNVLIGYSNRVDSATLAGGSWETTLPLAHLADPALYRVARSSDALAASTQFTLDLGAQYPLRLAALANHNLSRSAAWQIKVGNDDTFASTLYDSGSLSVWALDFGESLEWEDDTWWTGEVDDDWVGNPWLIAHAFDQIYWARYVSIAIADTENADGYVQLGRLFLGPAFVPVIGASYGLQDVWIDTGTLERGVSGAAHRRPGRRYREVRLSLPRLAHDADGDLMWELQRRAGTTEELCYLPYPDDTEAMQRFGFLAHFAELSPLDFDNWLNRATTLTLREIL